jgi:hypothetical protein
VHVAATAQALPARPAAALRGQSKLGKLQAKLLKMAAQANAREPARPAPKPSTVSAAARELAKGAPEKKMV